MAILQQIVSYKTAKNNNRYMRGRSADYKFLDDVILHILRESERPMQVLGVSFKVNEKCGRIINLNTVKNRLGMLADKRKILKKTDKEDSTFYWVSGECK